MTEKECINRLKTGNYGGEHGFDMQILIDTVGYVGEMMRDGRLMLLEPLCQWLAGYAAPPRYALKAVAPTSYRLGVVFTKNERVEAWKYHFRELLKEGEMG